MRDKTVNIKTNDVLSMLPPYPIVVVSTRTNAITINQVSYFTFAPLRIGIAIAKPRFSYDLVLQEREFVINVPTAAHIDAVKYCGAHSGRSGDKFAAAGLQVEPGVSVDAVRIVGFPAHIECQVERELDFENRTWFIGRVTAASCLPSHDGMSALHCGRTTYSLPGEIVAPRP